jgi:hypothetical protein
MFQICVIKENAFNYFDKSLKESEEIEKALKLLTFQETDDLNTTIGQIFNPGCKSDNYDGNTLDILYTRTHTYQLIYRYEGEDNFLGSILIYNREKKVRGPAVLVKVKLFNNGPKVQYQEDNFTQDDFTHILRDMYYHQGYHISSEIKLNQIEYDNKENTLLDINDFVTVTILGIPFKLWYKEGDSKNPLLMNIGLYVDKKVSEVYITCVIYKEKKCLSFDDILIKQFIDLISLYPDEEEIKIIENNYLMKNKDVRSDNIFILFEEFYWFAKSNN